MFARLPCAQHSATPTDRLSLTVFQQLLLQPLFILGDPVLDERHGAVAIVRTNDKRQSLTVFADACLHANWSAIARHLFIRECGGQSAPRLVAESANHRYAQGNMRPPPTPSVIDHV